MISTHILDTTRGAPAAQVEVILEIRAGAGWMEIGRRNTDADGRIVFDCSADAGDYRLTFAIEAYFKRYAQDAFFLNPAVGFRVTNTARKYHVPLLLNPFGHSTYRGS